MAVKYVVLFCLFIALGYSQKTPGFNDWTPAGTEREIELLFRDVNLFKEQTSDIVTTVDTFDAETNALNLPSKRKIYDNITTAMNDVARQANRAGFPLCAAKAFAFSVTAIPKYQTQIHSVNDIYTISAFKTKSQAAAYRVTLSTYRKDSEIASIQLCRNPATAVFGNTAIVNCYKRQLTSLTNNVRNLNSTLQSINREFENTKTRYNEFISSVNQTLTDAKTATDNVVDDVLDCAKLNSKEQVKETVDKLKQVFSNTSSFLNTNIAAVVSAVNGLKNKVNLSRNSIDANLRTAVQPFYSIGKFGKHLFPDSKVNIELEIDNRITANVDNCMKKVSGKFTAATAKLDDFLLKLNALFVKYNNDYGGYSESNVSASCVPKSTAERVVKRDEIVRCLNNLVVTFSAVSNEAKLDFNRSLDEYNLLITEVESTVKGDASIEAELIAQTKQDVEIFLKQTFGLEPNKASITAQIDKQFTGVGNTVSNIKQRVTDVNNQLIVVNSLKTQIDNSLNAEIKVALSSIGETVQNITKLNPLYNVSNLIGAQLKLETDVKSNISAYFERLKLNVDGLTGSWLGFNVDLEFKALQDEINKCFPSNITLNFRDVFACLSPVVVKFNTTLNRIDRLSEIGQTDVKLIVDNLQTNLKQFTDFTFAEAKRQANLIATIEFNKAKTFDYGKYLLADLKIDIDNTIKQQVKTFNEKTFKAIDVLNNTALKYQENLKTQIILPLINAYEKTFSLIPNQFLSLNERIANVNRFFDENKNYAMIMFQSLRNSRYESLKDLVKSVDLKLDNAFAKFTLDVNNSKCLKTNKQVFSFCIDPLLKVFLANKTTAEKEITSHESVVDFLLSLNSSLPLRPTKRIEELLNSLKFDFDYQKYLAERSQLNLKTVVDATPSRVDVVNRVNNFTGLVNSLNLNFQNRLQTSGDNPELKVYLSVRENQIQSKVNELNVLIESLKPTLQKAESEIKSQIATYKDFVVYCDGPEFKICVDAEYNAKDSKLSTSVSVFNNNALDVATIQGQIDNLKVEIEKTLKEVEEKTKLEEEKAINIEARKELVIDAIQKYNNSINEQIPAVDRIISIDKGASGVIMEYYNKAARNPNLNVTFQLGNVAFFKNFNDFGGCNSIDVIKGIINGMGNNAQVLGQVADQSRSVSGSYLYEQCSNITLLTSYKDCLETQLVVPNLNLTLINEIFSTFYFEA